MTATVVEKPISTEDDQTSELQARSAAVLVDLTSTKGLPSASWLICNIVPSKLSGQIYSRPGDDHDEVIRERVARWAEVFETEVVESSNEKFGRVTTTARINGVTVEIWGHIAPAALKAVV